MTLLFVYRTSHPKRSDGHLGPQRLARAPANNQCRSCVVVHGDERQRKPRPEISDTKLVVLNEYGCHFAVFATGGTFRDRRPSTTPLEAQPSTCRRPVDRLGSTNSPSSRLARLRLDTLFYAALAWCFWQIPFTSAATAAAPATNAPAVATPSQVSPRIALPRVRPGSPPRTNSVNIAA